MELRWNATINFNGGETRSVGFEEFEDLGGIIERGPDWKCIENIDIKLNPVCASRPDLTYHQAMSEWEMPKYAAA